MMICLMMIRMDVVMGIVMRVLRSLSRVLLVRVLMIMRDLGIVIVWFIMCGVSMYVFICMYIR